MPPCSSRRSGVVYDGGETGLVFVMRARIPISSDAACSSGEAPETAMDLARLVEATAAHDVQAFKTLYDATLPVMRAKAQRFAGLLTADDILQAAYIKVWEKAGRFERKRGGALAWMLRICRNVAIDELRRVRSMRRNEEWAVIEGDDGELRDGDLAIDLRSGWRLLPEDQADVLARAYVAGLTHDEIARELGVPVATVKRRIRRGLTSLKQSLSGGAR
jgi:RNA polymerase sigma-70 factor (ECF subfamily)